MRRLIAPSKLNALPSQFQSGINLSTIAQKCFQPAHELRDELATLAITPSWTRRQAIARFIQSKRKAKSIEELRARLGEYQKTLDTLVLVDIRYEMV
jgi:hypothetical protein